MESLHERPQEAKKEDGFDDLRTGRSYVDVVEDYMEVRPSRTSDQHFIAKVEDGLLRLDIKTTRDDEEGTRHPYFAQHRVTELAHRAIEHFDDSVPLEGMIFDWGEPTTEQASDRSDNYSTYVRMRDEFAKAMPYEEAQRRAVMMTWTGKRVAGPHEFTELAFIHEKGNAAHPTTVTGVLMRKSASQESAEKVR